MDIYIPVSVKPSLIINSLYNFLIVRVDLNNNNNNKGKEVYMYTIYIGLRVES